MAVKRLLKKFIKDSTRKIIFAFVLAIVGGVVLGLLLRPTKVEAQVYEPQIQDTDIQDNNGSTKSNEVSSGSDSSDVNACADAKGVASRTYCIEDAFQSIYTGDPGEHRTKESANSTVDNVLVVSSILAPVDPKLTDKQAQSPYWRRLYAAVPSIRKYGLLGITERATALAMIANPAPLDGAVQVYAYNFVPKQVLEITNVNVNAGLFDVFDSLGTPPSPENAFTILSPLIGGWWLAMFKLSTGIFVLVLIGAGIMIIMRQKVGQNTVTIYMAIKNLVIGYVGAFASFGLGTFFFNFSKWLMVIIARLVWSAWPSSLSKHIYFLDGVPQLTFFFSLKTLGAWFTNLFEFDSILGIIKTFAKFVPPGLVITIIGLIVQIIISGYAFVVFAKLLIKVIKIYINMLIDIILAPLIFLMGAIPGNENTISDWFKRMFKASIKVPLMFFIVNLGMMFAALPHLTLKNLTGGVINGGVEDWFWTTLNLTILIPITIISTANGVDGLIDQMWGGPSKSGAALAQGAQQVLKGMPLIGGAMQ